jgi:hypothetical protein
VPDRASWTAPKICAGSCNRRAAAVPQFKLCHRIKEIPLLQCHPHRRHKQQITS